MFETFGAEAFVYGIGALVLALGIGYGVFRNLSRNKRVDAVTEAATKEQYEHPERYQQTQEEFEREAERIEESERR
jgi:hypothetical protein